RRLGAFFCLWKSLLLLIALLSPGPGYDTSTHILLQQYQALSRSCFEKLVSKLTRWDAIYFASSSARGHLFEQEWAFSRFSARITSQIARGLSTVPVFPFTHIHCALLRHATAGIALSHISHFLAVVILYQLTYDLIPASHERKRRVAFTTACLHVVSPGGLFLSASYGESFFALTNFAGSFCYLASWRWVSRQDPSSGLHAAAWAIASGVLFGTATMVRGNGLLSGIMFAWDAVLYLPELPRVLRERTPTDMLRLFGVLTGGASVAIGYAIPQFEAYLEYCTGGNSRPWCTKIPPSIYTFVQAHYWNVGFLRYWTLSNIPLFALATPMLLVLLSTGWVAMNKAQMDKLADGLNTVDDATRAPPVITAQEKQTFSHHMARFALPQVLLAALALTSFHVQIINRISSGYPVWYILLACAMHAPAPSAQNPSAAMRFFAGNAQWLVRASVMYAMIQGGLYASFMPPA
ncbi:glycosyltransferase family 76 protein, partial [Pseudocercospora fijiensis CIRAD86]